MCFVIALILSMILTMSCVFAQSPQVVAKSMEAVTDIQPALTDLQVKTFVPENANVDVRRVALTGKKMSEAVIAYWVFESEPDGSAKPNAGTIVLQFNEDNQSWEKIWERKDEDAFHMEILDSGKLFNDETEQVALGSREGSGGFLSFYLLGKDENGKITVLMDKMNEEDGYYIFGGLKITDGDLWVTSASQGTRFHWNGKKFEESQFIDNPDISQAGEEDVIIHYSIDDEGNMTADYPNNAVIKLELNDRIFIVRDNYNEKIERILYSGNDVIDPDMNTHYKVYKALAPGKTSITIIPNGYDWDKAYTYEIKVIGSESNEQTSGTDAAEEKVQTIQVNFDKVHVKVNEQDIKTKTILYNGTTYVPIREAAEMLGKDVIWNSDTYTAHIQDKK